MNLVQSLLNFLKKKDTPEEHSFPEGFCPNCWGREEYGRNFDERVKKQHLYDEDSKVGWINDYANKHLKGISLNPSGNGEELICEGCNVTYKHADMHTDS